MPVIHNKRGRLTAYGLACGYIEQHSTPLGRITLWQEHGTYHVREWLNEQGRTFWHSFPTLTAARKDFAAAIRTAPREAA
jgi:hypothetical protein